MSLEKPALLFAVLLVLSGCNSSSSTGESSRTDGSPASGAALPSTDSGTSTVLGIAQGETTGGNNVAGAVDGSAGETSGSTGEVNGAGEDSVTGEDNGVTVGGEETSANENYYIDPTSPDFIESDQQHFRNALMGAWAATECRQLETVFSQPITGRSVFVFTDIELVETEYSYNSTDCTGVASSKWYPLPIRNWTLGAYRTLLDGTGAWELNTEITQRGVYGGEVLNDVGVDSYVNVGFVNGELEFNTLVENYKHTRPATRAGNYYKKIQSREIQTISNNDLLGSWYATCTGRLESNYEFNADSLVVTDENWADVGCEGDSYAVRKTTFDLLYEAPFVTLFENGLIPITLTAVSNELIKFDDSQGLDKPEFKVLVGKTEYRAVSIDHNTLILAYCLYRNSGEDDCQDSESRKPDMVDHNWAVQFGKVIER